jgi:PAS domain S-box-containing protein
MKELDNVGMYSLIQKLERRQLEMSSYLKKLEDQLSMVFAASPDVITFIQNNGIIVKISNAVESILGYSRDEIIGKSIWDFVHPDDIEKTRICKTQIIEGGIIYFDTKDVFTNRWLRSNGEYAKLAWRFSFYERNSDCIVGFATDITYMELENPYNFALIHRAIALTSDGVVITDNTTEDNPIIYANSSFCKNTQYSFDELVGKNCRMLQSSDKEQKPLNTLRNAIKNGIGCEVLVKNFRKDGSIMYNHLLVSPIVENGVVVNYIGISRDLTDLVNSGVYSYDENSDRGFKKNITS